MSLKYKKKQRLRRLTKKRAIKNANKARYAKLRELGQNSKSKRSLKVNKKKKLAKTYGHLTQKCCNVGCQRCYPHLPAAPLKVAA